MNAPTPSACSPPIPQRPGATAGGSLAGARQRGAAVFVVLLVITLLTALGLFAVRSSSLATMASGFNRQLTQTHYVADYAALAARDYMATVGPVTIAQRMQSGDDTTCVAYAEQLASGSVPECMRLDYDVMELKMQEVNNPSAFIEQPGGVYPTSVIPGSLGPAPVEGDMDIEITDLYKEQAPPAGYNATADDLTFGIVTVSAKGFVRPKQIVASQWDTVSATAAGVEETRLHLTIGPITK